MKRNTLFILFLIIGVIPLIGQSSKLVLIEEFSNTGCGPCAIVNPKLDSLLRLRLGDVVSVKYHVGWPDAHDEFYLNEKANQEIRKALYEVTSVPSIIVDGKMMRNTMTVVSDEIDAQMKEKSIFKLSLTSSLSNDNLHVKASVIPLQTLNNENLRLFIAIVEEEIVLDQPSKNGETHYYNILRKMLPDGNGYNLPEKWAQNKEETYETDWTISGFKNRKELGIISFIQDIRTKKVYETVYVPRNSDKTDYAKVLIAENLPDRICSPHFMARVKFRNMGKNILSQATVNVSVNGAVQQIPWSGKLEYLQYETITTPDFTGYELTEGETKNKVRIWLSAINGTESQSEIYQTTFDNSMTVKNQMQLTLFTDKKPEETTWKLFDSADQTVDEGGPYDKPREFYKKLLDIDSDDCYRLVFYDSGHNGIVGENGNGYYKIEQLESDGSSKLITQGDYKTAEHAIHFKMTQVNTSDIDRLEKENTVEYDETTRHIYVRCAIEPCHVSLFDLSGNTLYTTHLVGGYGVIPANKLERGIYLLQMEAAGKSTVQKMIIQ